MCKKIKPIENLNKLNNKFRNKNFDKKSNNNSCEFLKILIRIMYEDRKLSFEEIADILNIETDMVEKIYNK